ncbi:MAG: hypothetical protein ACLQBU_14400 [Terriglobales bacterium]
MNVSTIPDYISPIVGYRGWCWDATGLRSLNGDAWRPGRALTAKCPKADHEPVADGCSCGVYAAKDYQHLVNICYPLAVHGEVYLWGKICEHKLGYRAEYAYPKNLTISDWPIRLGIKMPRLETLVSYGVDMFFLPDEACERMLVWSREVGFNPSALERIAEKKQYKKQYKCLYGNKGCGENAVYCEPCNKRYEHFLWILNDDR